jgi:hypothetical protein
MESPFCKENKSFLIYLEPFLNTYYKSYDNIITLSTMPSGPLAEMVSPISNVKLSEFQDFGYNSIAGGNIQSCLYVLLRYPKYQCGNGVNLKNTDVFMRADDIPSVISYLQSNGYTVDTNITKMLFKSEAQPGGISDRRLSGKRKMICMVSY